jgi:hypothetical protein
MELSPFWEGASCATTQELLNLPLKKRKKVTDIARTTIFLHCSVSNHSSTFYGPGGLGSEM